MPGKLTIYIIDTVDRLDKKRETKGEQLLLFVWPFIGPVIQSLFCDVLKWDFTVNAFISK